MKFLSLALLFFSFILGACAEDAKLISFERDPSFFDPYLNSNDQFGDVKTNLAGLKLLQTGEEYPMRFVLFQDGRFYYQIDKLGDGQGRWKFHSGGIEMTAVRPIFDMHLYISAAAPTGEKTLIRFVDRHGFNSINLQLLEPSKTDLRLRAYKASEKEI